MSNPVAEKQESTILTRLGKAQTIEEQQPIVLELYEIYLPVVNKIVQKILKIGDHSSSFGGSEFVSSEIIDHIWKASERFDRSKGTEKAFVTMIATRRCVDLLRKHTGTKSKNIIHRYGKTQEEILEYENFLSNTGRPRKEWRMRKQFSSGDFPFSETKFSSQITKNHNINSLNHGSECGFLATEQNLQHARDGKTDCVVISSHSLRNTDNKGMLSFVENSEIFDQIKEIMDDIERNGTAIERRRICRLKEIYFEGMTNTEVAVRHSCPTSTVKTDIRNIKKTILKEYMRRYPGEAKDLMELIVDD